MAVAGATNDNAALLAVFYYSSRLHFEKVRRFFQRPKFVAHVSPPLSVIPTRAATPAPRAAKPGERGRGSGRVVKVPGTGKSRGLGERHNLLREAARGDFTISFVKLNADCTAVKIFGGA